jgi:uncharacterized membrane protein
VTEKPIDPWQTTARLAAAVGAVGSVVLTLLAGRRNPSVVLMAMFAVWVVLPFAMLAWIGRASSVWPRPARRSFTALSLIASAASLGVYGYMAFGSSRLKLAAPFLILPPILLILVAIVFLRARRQHDR